MINDFKRASTIEEAVTLSQQGYVYLAGGTQVNNTPFKKWGRQVENVVSLEPLGLNELRKDKDKLVIGSMITLQELADSKIVPSFLKEAASFIPTRSVRNMATIGGNVGANRPDSYIIPALVASGAMAELADDRSISVEEYIRGNCEELILRFVLTDQKGMTIAIKESRSQLALPVVSAAIHMSGSKGKVDQVIIAAGCVAPHCIRLSVIEKGIISGELGDGPELEDAIARAIDPKADTKGSSAYKTYINSVRIGDAIRFCRKELQS